MPEAKKPQGLQRKTPLKRGTSTLQRGKPLTTKKGLKADPKKGLKRKAYRTPPEKIRQQREKANEKARERARKQAQEKPSAPLMGGPGLSQGTPLKQSVPLKRALEDNGKKARPVPRKRPSRPTVTAEERSCRRVVADRSEGICEKCGRAGGLEKAHRIARSQGGRWDPSNVLDLCHDCHHGHHAEPQIAYDHGWHLRGHTADTAATPALLRKGWRVGWALLDNEGGYEWVDGPKWDESIMPTPL